MCEHMIPDAHVSAFNHEMGFNTARIAVHQGRYGILCMQPN